MDVMRGNQPESGLTLIISELRHNNVDVMVLQETRYPEERSIVEEGQGYTFFCKGLQEVDS